MLNTKLFSKNRQETDLYLNITRSKTGARCRQDGNLDGNPYEGQSDHQYSRSSLDSGSFSFGQKVPSGMGGVVEKKEQSTVQILRGLVNGGSPDTKESSASFSAMRRTSSFSGGALKKRATPSPASAREASSERLGKVCLDSPEADPFDIFPHLPSPDTERPISSPAYSVRRASQPEESGPEHPFPFADLSYHPSMSSSAPRSSHSRLPLGMYGSVSDSVKKKGPLVAGHSPPAAPGGRGAPPSPDATAPPHPLLSPREGPKAIGKLLAHVNASPEPSQLHPFSASSKHRITNDHANSVGPTPDIRSPSHAQVPAQRVMSSSRRVSLRRHSLGCVASLRPRSSVVDVHSGVESSVSAINPSPKQQKPRFSDSGSVGGNTAAARSSLQQVPDDSPLRSPLYGAPSFRDPGDSLANPGHKIVMTAFQVAQMQEQQEIQEQQDKERRRRQLVQLQHQQQHQQLQQKLMGMHGRGGQWKAWTSSGAGSLCGGGVQPSASVDASPPHTTEESNGGATARSSRWINFAGEVEGNLTLGGEDPENSLVERLALRKQRRSSTGFSIAQAGAPSNMGSFPDEAERGKHVSTPSYSGRYPSARGITSAPPMPSSRASMSGAAGIRPASMSRPGSDYPFSAHDGPGQARSPSMTSAGPRASDGIFVGGSRRESASGGDPASGSMMAHLLADDSLRGAWFAAAPPIGLGSQWKPEETQAWLKQQRQDLQHQWLHLMKSRRNSDTMIDVGDAGAQATKATRKYTAAVGYNAYSATAPASEVVKPPSSRDGNSSWRHSFNHELYRRCVINRDHSEKPKVNTNKFSSATSKLPVK